MHSPIRQPSAHCIGDRGDQSCFACLGWRCRVEVGVEPAPDLQYVQSLICRAEPIRQSAVTRQQCTLKGQLRTACILNTCSADSIRDF